MTRLAQPWEQTLYPDLRPWMGQACPVGLIGVPGAESHNMVLEALVPHALCSSPHPAMHCPPCILHPNFLFWEEGNIISLFFWLKHKNTRWAVWELVDLLLVLPWMLPGWDPTCPLAKQVLTHCFPWVDRWMHKDTKLQNTPHTDKNAHARMHTHTHTPLFI